MQPTKYPKVNEVLAFLLENIHKILGSKLVGLYLEGSLVIGDFHPDISDIDLVAVISGDIDDEEFSLLKKMHETFAAEHLEWDDRIEVCYITVDALGKVKSTTSAIVNISPGEPIHRKESSKEWITNWYLTRERGIVLFGLDPKTIIEPISKDEFIQSVKDNVNSWGDWIKTFSRNTFAQSYAILAMCRAFYVIRNGDQVSKKESALWAEKEIPEWSSVIQQALVWRDGPKHSPPNEVFYPKTVQFVEYVRGLVLTEN